MGARGAIWLYIGIAFLSFVLKQVLFELAVTKARLRQVIVGLPLICHSPCGPQHECWLGPNLDGRVPAAVQYLAGSNLGNLGHGYVLLCPRRVTRSGFSACWLSRRPQWGCRRQQRWCRPLRRSPP